MQTQTQLAPLTAAKSELDDALKALDDLVAPRKPQVVTPTINLPANLAGTRILIQREVVRNGRVTLVTVGTATLNASGDVVLPRSLRITKGTKLRVSANGRSLARVTAR